MYLQENLVCLVVNRRFMQEQATIMASPHPPAFPLNLSQFLFLQNQQPSNFCQRERNRKTYGTSLLLFFFSS